MRKIYANFDSVDRPLTINSRCLMVTCLTHRGGVGKRGGWEVRCKGCRVGGGKRLGEGRSERLVSTIWLLGAFGFHDDSSKVQCICHVARQQYVIINFAFRRQLLTRKEFELIVCVREVPIHLFTRPWRKWS